MADRSSFTKLIGSVVAAAFGVQSEQNRQRDFGENNALPFIIGGLLFVIIFVFSLIGLVNLFLS